MVDLCNKDKTTDLPQRIIQVSVLIKHLTIATEAP